VERDELTFVFVIRKIHSSYLVSYNVHGVTVEPLYHEKRLAACATLASTMQMVGQSKLLLRRPQDPCQFLMDYYRDLGWSIEMAN
jgi:hypothetical protein